MNELEKIVREKIELQEKIKNLEDKIKELEADIGYQKVLKERAETKLNEIRKIVSSRRIKFFRMNKKKDLWERLSRW